MLPKSDNCRLLDIVQSAVIRDHFFTHLRDDAEAVAVAKRLLFMMEMMFNNAVYSPNLCSQFPHKTQPDRQQTADSL